LDAVVIGRSLLKGFLDDDVKRLDEFKGYPPILDTISNYVIQENDVFTCSIGEVLTKYKLCSSIIERGGEFITLIHKQARVCNNVTLGKGCIVAPFCLVDCDTIVGEMCLLQSDAVIGHNCTIGSYTRIDTHVTLVAGTVIGDRVTIHTSAVINHKVKVEDEAIVGACSFVIRKVKSGTTVVGNPAKKLME
jgi:sugar O-acyltransferase (sialic acid O-acetyltransferase NeuD family)